MNRTMVQYEVRPDAVDENVALVEAVYAELAQAAPAGFHYETHRAAGGCTFVHVATTADGVEGRPLTTLAAFAAFRAGLADRCVSGPTFTELEPVGAYVPRA